MESLEADGADGKSARLRGAAGQAPASVHAVVRRSTMRAAGTFRSCRREAIFPII